MSHAELTTLLVGTALVGWAVAVMHLDRRFYIPERLLPVIFFGGGLLVIYAALRAAGWLFGGLFL